MFELKIALRYLLPRRRSLSTALVSLVSVGVISLVVWLVIVFLSVTSGIERNWLSKLTSLHAPLRVSPTDRYYSSYYYLVDSVSAASNYNLKTLGEKAASPKSDPFSEESDAEVPLYWPPAERSLDGALRDPVKELYSVLDELKVPYQDYEIAGALLRLSLHREGGSSLSQMSYLLSLMDKNPAFSSLILPPSNLDLDALLRANENNLEALKTIGAHSHISKVSIGQLPLSLIPKGAKLTAFTNPALTSEVLIPLNKDAKEPTGWTRETLIRTDSGYRFATGQNSSYLAPLLEQKWVLDAELIDGEWALKGTLQDIPIQGRIPIEGASVFQADPAIQFDSMQSSLPPWAISIQGESRLPKLEGASPALLPKSYRDLGLLIGDIGSLSFSSPGAGSSQEQRIPIRVVGFYDPGLFSLGGRCLIVPPEITRTIHLASQTFSPDGTPTNGVFVWNGSLYDAEHVKKDVQKRLDEAGISAYWKVSTFKDFEFSKEMFQQFRSDRTLFMMIAVLILLVASCNVISLLILLVNDKKREIAILQAMGASKKSIAAIFGCCGFVLGTLSSLIGTMMALFTLRHIDAIASFLSALQGHAAFQPAFFGKTLPSELSFDALLFVFITTPLLSLLAGLIPALRASKVQPTYALRQE